MILSVIVVNYNVKCFLEQCLCSVRKSILAQNELRSNAEIIVVDNHSNDGSLEWLRPSFPEVHFISNEMNKGFSVACNQGLAQASGEYVLFLNPDTILPEDFFEVCLSFLQSNRNAGAIGVRMIDGTGKFLRESKRGFPSPWAAFCRLSGLSSLLPGSRLFSYYYLGHLKEDQTNPVDILSGACMLVKREVLQKTGGFDEQFFMYAEDIDLSYRISQAGFMNYYLPLTTIIHFKGESTVKDRQYVQQFYRAMDQFSKKHLHGNKFFQSMLRLGVHVRSYFANTGNTNAKQTYEPVPEKYFLEGDMDSMEEARPALVSKAKLIVKNEEEANQILYCEGRTYPFKKIIESLDRNKSTKRFRIHALNSRSVVGSDSNSEPGETISF
ncbi:MAG TPA: glycosyltransferase family 2 protein [Puia sp.]|nr:glycosyltransferase family 2 protein [Puia sp.]